MQRRARLAALILALPLIAWLDGWFAFGSAFRAPAALPPELSETLGRVAADLSRRADAFAKSPEVTRSIEGGGIAVRRQALFAAARQALDGAPPGTWIVLADPKGNAHAWWGDAPAQIPAFEGSGHTGARWSATRMELLHWREAGVGEFAGVVCAGRFVPAEAPEFARSLGLSGAALRWEPIAPVPGAPLVLASPESAPLVAGRPASAGRDAPRTRAGVVLGLVILVTLWVMAPPSGAWSVGAGLAVAFLAVQAWAGGGTRALDAPPLGMLALGLLLLPPGLSELRDASRSETDRPRTRALRIAGGYVLLGLAFLAAQQIRLPDLSSTLPMLSAPSASIVSLAALLGAALAWGASGSSAGRPRGWTTAAVAITGAAVLGGILFVSPSPRSPYLVAAAAALAYETWRRSIASAPQAGALGPFRLLAGATLLLVLVAAPLHEHRRAADALRVAAAIRLPDPERVSASAVVAVRRAVERVERFDLGRKLPAPLPDLDLSDLAYRLWSDGEKSASSSSLMAYEVYDGAGMLRSRFSLIPEEDARPAGDAPGILIERHRVDVARQAAVLSENGRPWGRAIVSVADWPVWDPLPPRLEVYRRLVSGQAPPLPSPRPVLGRYGPDGSPRSDAPELPAATFEKVRRTGRSAPVVAAFRGEELRGELRPMADGFRLVAIPGPGFLQRLLTAALLLPAAAVLYGLGVLVVLWRFLAARRRLRDLVPRGSRTFRGRLVALFAISVMVPLLAVTFFMRASITERSRQDTLDHARTGLETARRVLDDYLPSASARGRLELVDDALLSWLANAVGFDLSVYSPTARLIASSRRDLYAAGLLPERVPGPTFVAIGLGETRERADARLIAGSRFEEITTALAALPGVPGVRSPALLSALLLPQQRVAEAEAAQLTAAFSAFSLLVFLVSAALAGRLAVRVARPVADLVEGTRAVARGDFSPRLSEPPDEELRELVRAFLTMSRSLKEQTDALSQETERLATLLSQLTAGVVAYREDGRVILANPAAAHLGRGRVDGSTIEEVFPGEAMQPVREVLSRFDDAHVSEELEPRPGERWRVVTVPLPLGGAGVRMAVIEDVSDVVRSNRLAAWAEMARIIAHEIKNPLTPIRLSVEHLREVWRRGSPDFDRVLEECVDNVLRQTDELRRSAAEFSDYARLPRPEMRPTDVGGLVREAASAYAGAPGIRWNVEAPSGLVAVADPRLLTRVLSNLIGNAVEALRNGGEIRIRVERSADRIRVTVEDDGPGVPPQILSRLFDPYFSTKSGGTGLGLAIAKRVVEEHGGTIGAESSPGRGFRVRFELPAASEASS